MTVWFWGILKLSEIINSNLSNQTKFRLNEINKIKDYFNSEIQERKRMSKNLVNTLLFLITMAKLWLFYLQQVEECQLFLLQVLLLPL